LCILEDALNGRPENKQNTPSKENRSLASGQPELAQDLLHIRHFVFRFDQPPEQKSAQPLTWHLTPSDKKLVGDELKKRDRLASEAAHAFAALVMDEHSEPSGCTVTVE
jgi:hypothetical protein